MVEVSLVNHLDKLHLIPFGLRTELRVLRPPLFLFLVLIVLLGTVFLREI